MFEFCWLSVVNGTCQIVCPHVLQCTVHGQATLPTYSLLSLSESITEQCCVSRPLVFLLRFGGVKILTPTKLVGNVIELLLIRPLNQHTYSYVGNPLVTFRRSSRRVRPLSRTLVSPFRLWSAQDLRYCMSSALRRRVPRQRTPCPQ